MKIIKAEPKFSMPRTNPLVSFFLEANSLHFLTTLYLYVQPDDVLKHCSRHLLDEPVEPVNRDPFLNVFSNGLHTTLSLGETDRGEKVVVKVWRVSSGRMAPSTRRQFFNISFQEIVTRRLLCHTPVF